MKRSGIIVGVNEFRFAGFWIRLWASILDTLLYAIILIPVLFWFIGVEYFEAPKIGYVRYLDFFITYIFPMLAVLLFWTFRQATPGKMVCKIRLINARTGGKPGGLQLIWRYFAYFFAALPLGVGFLMIAIDPRKQGLHDKLSRICVVHDDYYAD